MADVQTLREQIRAFGRGTCDTVVTYESPIECRLYDAGAGTVILDHLHIDADHRGGIGKQILQEIEAAAAQRGCDRLEVEIHASDGSFEGASKALLQNNGYTVDERAHGATDGTIYHGDKSL